VQGLHTPPARPPGQAFRRDVPRGTSRVAMQPGITGFRGYRATPISYGRSRTGRSRCRVAAPPLPGPCRSDVRPAGRNRVPRVPACPHAASGRPSAEPAGEFSRLSAARTGGGVEKHRGRGSLRFTPPPFSSLRRRAWADRLPHGRPSRLQADPAGGRARPQRSPTLDLRRSRLADGPRGIPERGVGRLGQGTPPSRWSTGPPPRRPPSPGPSTIRIPVGLDHSPPVPDTVRAQRATASGPPRRSPTPQTRRAPESEPRPPVGNGR
jgi:hypothetical protein